jgi:hypothetical protein
MGKIGSEGASDSAKSASLEDMRAHLKQRAEYYAALVPAVDYHPPRNAGRALEAFIEHAPLLVMKYRPTGAIAFGVTAKVPSP